MKNVFTAAMKFSAFISLLAAGLLAAGCISHKPKPAPATKPTVASPNVNIPYVPQATQQSVVPPQIVTPANPLTATVVLYNPTAQFVVLNFPVGQIPALNQTMYLYRAGMKVGEVKISGPQSGENIVADLVTGDAQVGDEVRTQ